MSEVTNHGISIGLIFLQLHVILIAIPHRITILCISICFHSCLSDKRLRQLILYKHVVNNIFHVPKVLASFDAFFFFAKYLSIFLYCFFFSSFTSSGLYVQYNIIYEIWETSWKGQNFFLLRLFFSILIDLEHQIWKLNMGFVMY